MINNYKKTDYKKIHMQKTCSGRCTINCPSARRRVMFNDTSGSPAKRTPQDAQASAPPSLVSVMLLYF